MKLAHFTGVFLLLVIKGDASPVLQNLAHLNMPLQAYIPAKCPPGYTQHKAPFKWTSCYKVYPEFKTEQEAAIQCKLDNAKLATVMNSFVNSYIYYLATQVGATSVWLGVECSDDPTIACNNDDGTNLSFNSFKPGQPNPSASCVFMSTVGMDGALWATIECENRFSFVCEVSI